MGVGRPSTRGTGPSATTWVERTQLPTEGGPVAVSLGAGPPFTSEPRTVLETLPHQAYLPLGRTTWPTDTGLTCWEQGRPPGGKATGKCRARCGGSSCFFLRMELSQ